MQNRATRKALVLATLAVGALLVFPSAALASRNLNIVTHPALGGYMLTLENRGLPTYAVDSAVAWVTVPALHCASSFSESGALVGLGNGLGDVYGFAELLMVCDGGTPTYTVLVEISGGPYTFTEWTPVAGDQLELIAGTGVIAAYDKTQRQVVTLEASLESASSAFCLAASSAPVAFSTIHFNSCMVDVNDQTKSIAKFAGSGFVTEFAMTDPCQTNALIAQTGPLTFRTGGFVVTNIHAPLPACTP